jgi:D-3-phosphoglycerate dehydrogenase
MKVAAWGRNFTIADADQAGFTYCQTPLEVARLADAVTINVAATGETRHLCNAEFFGAMKPGAYFINTSRGSVVDEAALIQAVREKKIRAGLDVYQNEPGGSTGEFSNPIGKEPGVFGTHHVGASTDQAQVAIAHEVLRIVSAFKRGGEVPNCVNQLARSTASFVLAVRHQNKPGVLAHVFRVLADNSINVEEVENISYHGAVASLARIHLDHKPGDKELGAIRSGNPHIISVELSSLNGRTQ